MCLYLSALQLMPEHLPNSENIFHRSQTRAMMWAYSYSFADINDCYIIF